ncbi:NosD domain-containing protein [Paludibaculum fermentans]|uniref:NosD domain-containing protein n=1 Tax=Paludibaculum fermentans TaxID=1473598 RepID=UPI003EB7FAA6
MQDLIFELGPTGTLIVDKACTIGAGLRLPPRFTLKGKGIGAGGQIKFLNDGIGLSMCQEAPSGYVTISGIDLYGPSAPGNSTAPHSTGIAIANQNIVYLTNVRVSDFQTGVSGVGSYSVFINGCNISNNRGDNLVIGYNSNGWRIRDGIVSQAGGWGINVLGPGDDTPIGLINTSNDLLIDGVRMESNYRGAVRTNAYGTRVTNSRFESNGLGSMTMPHRGLLVESQAQDARILTNIFSSDCIQIQNLSTQRAFNIPDDRNTTQCAALGFSR